MPSSVHGRPSPCVWEVPLVSPRSLLGLNQSACGTLVQPDRPPLDSCSVDLLKHVSLEVCVFPVGLEEKPAQTVSDWLSWELRQPGWGSESVGPRLPSPPSSFRVTWVLP